MTKSTCGPSLANQSPSGHHLLHVTNQDKLPFGHHPFPPSPYPPLISRTKTLPRCCPTLPPAQATSAAAGRTLARAPQQQKKKKKVTVACALPCLITCRLQMASFAVATIPSLAAPAKKRSGVTCVEGMNAYHGLKGLNKVTMLGVRKTADYSFAKIVASLSPAGKQSRGSAFGAQMNAAAEIFRIAVTMNGLVLVGVAVGFVLLRVEAAVEESE
ncbi:hypothetical protein EJB05_04302, partial [Eragrostis curvula]